MALALTVACSNPHGRRPGLYTSVVVLRVSERLEATVEELAEIVYIGDPVVIINGHTGLVRNG